MYANIRRTTIGAICLCTLFVFLHKPSATKTAIRDYSPTGHIRRSLANDDKKQFKILNLGGPESRGQDIESLYTYPSVLSSMPENEVVNFSWPQWAVNHDSHCIQSMIGEEVYDVVLIEEVHNLEMLTKRLRAHFPDAILIYVQFYKLEHEAVDANNVSAHDLNFKTGWLDWFWGEKTKESDVFHEYLDEIMEPVGGFVYRLPRHAQPNDSIPMFNGDWNHPSINGHKVIAGGVMDIVEKVFNTRAENFQPRIDTWENSGDQCYDWFHTGDFGDLTYDGLFVPKIASGQFQLTVRKEGNIKFSNKESFAVPLFISFITISDISAPEIKFTWQPGDHSATLIPNQKRYNRMIRQIQLGWAEPGLNELHIEQDSEASDFRIVAMELCGACVEHEADILIPQK